jgi:hypothetical protein
MYIRVCAQEKGPSELVSNDTVQYIHRSSFTPAFADNGCADTSSGLKRPRLRAC